MKRKYLRIFLLVFIVSIAFTGYLKGCDSQGLPKQFPISQKQKENLKDSVPDFRDSIIKVAVGKHYKKNKVHNIIYGSHYRDLWALPVPMRVFDIGRDKGGFEILKKGGSQQTLNLRLESEDGKEYVLRSIDKDPTKALPPPFRNRILVNWIRDQTSALNPYGALIIPTLAEAAGIMHTHPELVFIPYDKRFGPFTDLFEGRVAILEEYADETWADEEKFNNAEDIISTTDMLSKRYSSQDIVIDEKEYAKARLFDLLINDWDRHVDQWRWAEFTQDSIKIYKPIPRDRDAAFFKFDTGIIPRLVLAFNQKFQTFDCCYGDLEGLIRNARYLDGVILNSISQEELIAIAKELQTKLTDSVITEAVKSLPEEVFEKIGPETIQILKVRRNKLDEAAKEYYQLLFDEVKIVGTDEKEDFLVERINDTLTSVTMKTNKGEAIYNRTFNHRTTEEITLYGLDGADEFLVKGKVDNGIIINIYGGQGYDKIRDESWVQGYRKKTKVYDIKGREENEIIPSEETEDRTSYDPEIVYYDRVGIN